MDSNFRLFVVGASSGGRSAITKLLSEIPASINACFLIAVHSAFDTPSFFAEVLKQKTKLKVMEASHGQGIERGLILVARPDHHLFVHNRATYLSKGPRENMSVPLSMYSSGRLQWPMATAVSVS